MTTPLQLMKCPMALKLCHLHVCSMSVARSWRATDRPRAKVGFLIQTRSPKPKVHNRTRRHHSMANGIQNPPRPCVDRSLIIVICAISCLKWSHSICGSMFTVTCRPPCLSSSSPLGLFNRPIGSPASAFQTQKLTERSQ